ncbi:MAG: alpha/beta fold hydrolase [Akkermansiaceae bacterium]|nr:alpha/beta fold hydrolase [Akkermansiaceae bacterium]
MKRPRLLLTGLAAAVLLPALGLMGLGWSRSKGLVSPRREALRPEFAAMLADPARHGLQITKYTGPDDTPCLLVTPVTNPSAATNGDHLRAELEKRRVTLPPWGSTAGTVVLLHGLSARKEDQLPICERLCAAGFRCILPDLPAHGENPAPLDTFGATEAPLVSRILSDASQRFAFPPAPSFLFGFSQGGAMALRAAALHPNQWAGLVSVSAFGSLDVLVKNLAAGGLPRQARFLSPLVDSGYCLGIRSRGGYWPSAIRPVDFAAKVHVPVFLAHGEKDTAVPVDEARRIFAALPDARKSFRMVPGADHSSILGENPAADGLYADICAFLLKTLDDRHPVIERTE